MSFDEAQLIQALEYFSNTKIPCVVMGKPANGTNCDVCPYQIQVKDSLMRCPLVSIRRTSANLLHHIRNPLNDYIIGDSNA